MQLQESLSGSLMADNQFHNKESQACDISFLISTYNRASYVEECVRGLLSIQTPYSFEVIVRDNGSGDNTRAVIEQITDPRLHYVRAPKNQGTISFLEVGRLAKGKLITWLSDEDNFEFQHLDYVINTFRSDPACNLLIGSVTVGPHSTEIIFPEKVITDPAEALVFTLRFSGCAGVFVRSELFRKNCKFHPANQYDAYKLWNYYPIGFFATSCLEGKLITTSRILVRQARQAPTTDNWGDIENSSTKKTILYPHYYPKSISDRLYSNLVNVFQRNGLSLRAKIKILEQLTTDFQHQIDSAMHASLINLLSDHYPQKVVDAYQHHMQSKRLHVSWIRKLWIAYKLAAIPLRLIDFYNH